MSDILKWDTCGDVFYGWAPPDAISGMDWSVPRCCNLPKLHRGGHDWSPIYSAGHFPLRENRSEKRRRILNEKRQLRAS
jgi:hypothetical protein